jgi:SAM-dependent methyltransferase
MTHHEHINWDGIWSGVDNTLTRKDTYYLIDETKMEYLRSLLPSTNRFLRCEKQVKGRILEIGIGSGRLSCFLAAEGYHSVGIDMSDEALRVAGNNFRVAGVTGALVKGDAYSLPFHRDSFDIVMSTGLLEHFDDPLPIVREMVRVLKPGGLFYSDIVPQKFSLFRSLDFINIGRLLGRRQMPDPNALYERGFKRGEIAQILTRAGCENVVVFPMGVFLPAKFFRKRLGTDRFQYPISRAFAIFGRHFDRTWIAEVLGFLYFAYGRKA